MTRGVIHLSKLVGANIDKESNVHVCMSIEVLDSINSTFKLHQPHTTDICELLVFYNDKKTSIEV